MSVSNDLKELRARYRYSLAECAAAMGRSIETYRQTEAGERTPTGAELALLADFYGLPMRRAFPNFEPGPGEKALIRHAIASAA